MVGSLLIGVLFFCMDNIGQKTQVFNGIVEQKIFKPAHTNYIMYNKPWQMIPVDEKEKWLVEIRLKDFPNTRSEIEISHKIFERCHEGDVVKVNVGIGRLSKQKQIITLII